MRCPYRRTFTYAATTKHRSSTRERFATPCNGPSALKPTSISRRTFLSEYCGTKDPSTSLGRAGDFSEGRIHVHADVPNFGRVAPMRLQVSREVECRLVALALRGEQQPLGVVVVYDGDVVLASARAGLVDADHLDALEAIKLRGLVNIEFDASPQLLVATAQQRSSAAAWRRGNSWHSASAGASASKAPVNPEPRYAQGTLNCVVLPQLAREMHGTFACSQASDWKKSRYRHERRSRSCTGCEVTPQRGQASSAPA